MAEKKRSPAAPPDSERARLAKLGLVNDTALALHLPLRYEDETRIRAIAELADGETAQIEAAVRGARVLNRPRRMLMVELADDSGAASARFFNFYGSQLKQLSVGTRLRVRGQVRVGLTGVEFVHPSYRVVGGDDAPLPTTLTPVYPTMAGLAQHRLRSAIARALARSHWPETLPVPQAEQWLPLAQALATLHHPPAQTDQHSLHDRTHPAWQRVIIEELVAQQLSLRRARAARAAMQAPALADQRLALQLLERLPFKLTDAQRRAWERIAADLAQAAPMQRLLQGDVGSGKTVVAALAAATAVGSGFQAAIMAPTEVLAEQHWRKLAQWLPPLGIRAALLTGSLREKEKRELSAALAEGAIDIAIGTHALLEERAGFARLGLAVVDEQHRFGVKQRLALRAKRAGRDDSRWPHQLMMSATPIPRTLAMSYYADLDVSVIDELPRGRKPVLTKLVSDRRRDEVIERIRAVIADSAQVYWVCPLVDDSETLDLESAIATHAQLQQALTGARVALLHGKMAPAEKAATMAALESGQIDVLVATTVIEVGVDVPNASLMVIEHAERFGLAQLHQLRGRVGRGVRPSACILLYRPPLSPLARERLKVVYSSQDGFKIAEQDLTLRGPGEFLGARQSGTSLLRFADLERDSQWLPLARRLAEQMLEQADQSAVEQHLARWLPGREAFLKA